MRKSYTQFEVSIYEVKANRADFAGDVRREKWRKYLPFCHRFYWAAPTGLIATDELAEEAGLIAHSDKGWHTVRKPPRRSDIQFDFDILLSVLFACGTEEMKNRNLRDRLNAAKWGQQGWDERASAKAFGKEVAELVRFARQGGAEAIIRERDRYRRGFERLCRRIGVRRKRDQEELLGEGRWADKQLAEAVADFASELQADTLPAEVPQ